MTKVKEILLDLGVSQDGLSFEMLKNNYNFILCASFYLIRMHCLLLNAISMYVDGVYNIFLFVSVATTVLHVI